MTENAALAAIVIAYLATSSTVAIVRAALNFRTAKRRDEARGSVGRPRPRAGKEAGNG
jgi:hypothetical protein